MANLTLGTISAPTGTLSQAASANTSSTLVVRDASGNFSATTITANLTGNASGSAASFTGALVGDVTGTQGATVVATVGGQTAANIANATSHVNAASTSGYVLTANGTAGGATFQAPSAIMAAAATSSGGAAALNTTYFGGSNSYTMTLPATSTIASGQLGYVRFINDSTGQTTVTVAGAYIGNQATTTNLTLSGQGSAVTLMANTGGTWIASAVAGTVSVN